MCLGKPQCRGYLDGESVSAVAVEEYVPQVSMSRGALIVIQLEGGPSRELWEMEAPADDDQ